MKLEDWPDAMKVYKQRMADLFGIAIQNWSQNGLTLSVGYSKGNHSFKDSKYFLDPKGQTFSHLTTYRGLFGVINSGVIRLYNLHNSNDPNELFSLKGVPTYGDVAENVKRYVHTFSFCQDETIRNPKIWQDYGQVTINFQIANDPMLWDFYRLSPMYYGESDLIPKYWALLNEMHEGYPEWHFKPHLESLLSLLSFHKEEKHSYEKEIRLLHIPFLFDDEGTAHYDFRISDYRTGLTKYVEMPLYVGNEENLFTVSKVKKHVLVENNSLPIIKVISIEFGDNEPHFSQSKLNNLRHELEDYLIAKFGYQIEVKPDLFKTGIDIA